MPSYAFTVVLGEPPTETVLNTSDEYTVDGSTFGTRRGMAVVGFHRHSASLAEAIASAIRHLERAGMKPVRIVDDDLLTLADIADRVGQSRESIRRYAAGERGPGGFPPPVNPARDGTAFYRWSEVTLWMRQHLAISVSDVDPTLVVANLLLQARQLIDQVDHAPALVDLLAARIPPRHPD